MLFQQNLSGARGNKQRLCSCGLTYESQLTSVCASQVRGAVNGQLFSLSNVANSKTITEGISQRGSSEVVYRSFSSVPNDIFYWVLPESFRGDKVREEVSKVKTGEGRREGKLVNLDIFLSLAVLPQHVVK